MNILGDIGNTETKIFLVTSKFKVIKKISFLTKNINLIKLNDIFDNFKKINLDVIEHIGCNIVDDNSFEQKINQWQHGQNKIWKQWENYIQYKDTILGKAKYDVDLFGDLVLESLIQYHLREVGIELKCDGLNRFPTSGEIKKYYE